MANIESLVPKLKNQSDYYWDYIKPVLNDPDKFSISEILGEYHTGDGPHRYINSCVKDSEKRQAIWILSVLLFYCGKDSHENREKVLNLIHKWNLDEAIFYEMKDTIETYKSISKYQDRVESWNTNLKNELSNNWRELDESIKNLIELG